MKVCKICKQSLSLNVFRDIFDKRHSKTYKSSYCKSCENRKSYLRRKNQSRIVMSKAWCKKRFDNLKKEAKKRNLIVDINLNDYMRFRKNNICYYCNSKNIKWSLDRKDNSQGYTVDNCVACCMRCNVVKGARFTDKEMKILGKALGRINKLRNETVYIKNTKLFIHIDNKTN